VIVIVIVDRIPLHGIIGCDRNAIDFWAQLQQPPCGSSRRDQEFETTFSGTDDCIAGPTSGQSRGVW